MSVNNKHGRSLIGARIEALERSWREYIARRNAEIMTQMAEVAGLDYIPIERLDARVERELVK